MTDPYQEKAREIRLKLKLRHEDYCHCGSSYCLNCNEADKLIALALREAVEAEREACARVAELPRPEAFQEAFSLREEHFIKRNYGYIGSQIANKIRSRNKEGR